MIPEAIVIIKLKLPIEESDEQLTFLMAKLVIAVQMIDDNIAKNIKPKMFFHEAKG